MISNSINSLFVLIIFTFLSGCMPNGGSGPSSGLTEVILRQQFEAEAVPILKYSCSPSELDALREMNAIVTRMLTQADLSVLTENQNRLQSISARLGPQCEQAYSNYVCSERIRNAAANAPLGTIPSVQC